LIVATLNTPDDDGTLVKRVCAPKSYGTALAPEDRTSVASRK
jgi:hypothetical protein